MAALDSYRRAWATLPADLRQTRAQAWADFEAQGFPGRKLEDWRYTDLGRLADADYTLAPGGPAELPPAAPGCQRLGFVNGHADAGGCADATLADDSVTRLNASLATAGCTWTIPANSQPKALQLLSWTTGEARPMAHLRHRIVVERGADATVLLESGGDAGEAFTTEVCEVELAAGSRLRLLRLQDCGAGTTSVARTEVRVGRDAELQYCGLDLGSALSRHDLNVRLSEPGARVTLDGVFAPAPGQHHDTHTRILHQAPHTTSRETYRGLVAERARAVFNGRIVVEKHAQKTDSAQHLASLLLSPKAEINAKPELEIYADDVKCAHGATCGQLDEMALYYLRSRGLDHDAARSLLLFTFVHAVLGGITDPGLRRYFERRLLTRLPGGPALEELL